MTSGAVSAVVGGAALVAESAELTAEVFVLVVACAGSAAGGDGDGATVRTGATSTCAGVTCSLAAGVDSAADGGGIGRGRASGTEIAGAATPTASSYDGSEESFAFDCEGCGRVT